MYYLIFTGRKNGSMHANFVCSITGNSGNAGKALLGIWFIHPGTTTVINVYRCPRDLLHRGPIEGPCASQHYRIGGFKGAFNWVPITPRDTSLSDSKCGFFPACLPAWNIHGIYYGDISLETITYKIMCHSPPFKFSSQSSPFSSSLARKIPLGKYLS